MRSSMSRWTARSAVAMRLSNIYTLYYRLRFVAGRLPGGEYAFGVERDRHRWLRSFDEAAPRRAEAAGLEPRPIAGV